MKLKQSYFGAAIIGALALAGTAQAQGEFTGNVALTTDYTWRGISQTDGDPAISGGFDYTNDMFYAGAWASNVDFGAGSDANIEVDFYGGLASEFSNGISWDVGVIYYAYPGADDEDLDFVEVKGALGYEFDGGVSVGGEAYYDFDNENLYLQATAGYGFTEDFSADVSVGNYDFEGGGDYVNWSVGGTYSLSGFDVDLRYWGTDIDDVDIADERIVLTLSRSL